jgi:RNA polymerase subunit RPABC4/transcription elongation factor Spt4
MRLRKIKHCVCKKCGKTRMFFEEEEMVCDVCGGTEFEVEFESLKGE